MYALLADTLLVLHVAIVLFVVGAQALVLVGGPRGWTWVRNRAFRFSHLALIGFIVLQTWLGRLCPLTIWEQQLRAAAGQAVHHESFIQHWLSRLLFVEAPWWVFVAVYTAFFALVLASFRRWPPRPRPRPHTGTPST